MKTLLYLVLILGSLLGCTAPVSASDALPTDEVPGSQQGDERCLSKHGILPDLPPLSGDDEPRIVAEETVLSCLYRSAPVELFISRFLPSSSSSPYPIRAPPHIAL